MDDLIGIDPKTLPTPAPARNKGGRPPLSPYPDLDKREVEFCHYILRGYKAQDAAIRAGYKPRTPTEDIGRVIYNRPHIKDALEWMQAEHLKGIGVTFARVASEFATLAFFDPRKLVDNEGRTIPLHLLDKETAAGIEGMDITETEFNGVSTVTKIKYKLHPKIKALDSLAKFLGMFVDKVEVTGQGGGPVQVEEIGATEMARRVAFLLLQAQRDKGQTYEAEK